MDALVWGLAVGWDCWHVTTAGAWEQLGLPGEQREESRAAEASLNPAALGEALTHQLLETLCSWVLCVLKDPHT